MKANNHLNLRQLLLCGILLTVFAFLVCLPFFPKWDRQKFQALSRDLYLQEMTTNTLNLHYSLANPWNFGITDYTVTLPLLSQDGETERTEFLERLLKRLYAIHRQNLSPEDAHAYDCLARNLQLSLSLSHFPYYSDPLSSTQGIHCQLPILFCEYEFRNRRDIDDYLTLLGQTGVFFESLLAYEEEMASRGRLLSRSSLQKSREQCDTIVTFEALDKGEHFLQTSFKERLAEFQKLHPLDESTLQSLIQKNDEALRNVVYPAYQRLKLGLHSLETKAPAESRGLASLPGGKEYYASLLALETGSDKDPEAVRRVLNERLALEESVIRQLLSDYPACRTALLEGTYQDLGMENPYAMLEDLKMRMAGEFPFPSDPRAVIKDVDPSLENHSAPAFYLTAPLDQTDKNVIYVNRKNDPNEFELYTTLAHEGFPGHLYQNACMAANLLSLPESRIRQILHCGGYLEGWAVYVEQRSHDYCSRLLAGQNRTADAICVQLEKHVKSLSLCLYSLADLMIHYDGATESDLYEFLSAHGVKEEAAASALYEYVCNSPCNYPKYYLGYLEILELKQEAKELWGDHYSDYKFHVFLLDWGPADFPNLRKQLKQ